MSTTRQSTLQEAAPCVFYDADLARPTLEAGQPVSDTDTRRSSVEDLITDGLVSSISSFGTRDHALGQPVPPGYRPTSVFAVLRLQTPPQFLGVPSKFPKSGPHGTDELHRGLPESSSRFRCPIRTDAEIFRFLG